MSNNKNHNERARLIALKPEMLGLTKIVLATTEVNLFHRGKIISQPDNLLFDSSTKILYNIEYKCHDNKNQSRRAQYQLNKANLLLKSIFRDFKITNLYIHDDYRIEVIK